MGYSHYVSSYGNAFTNLSSARVFGNRGDEWWGIAPPAHQKKKKAPTRALTVTNRAGFYKTTFMRPHAVGRGRPKGRGLSLIVNGDLQDLLVERRRILEAEVAKLMKEVSNLAQSRYNVVI